MRVFVAGAGGAIGAQLVPKLIRRGHEVVGTTRSAAKAEAVRARGATSLVVDALDPDQVARAVAEVEPDAIVHELTSLGDWDMRHFDRTFALTNRLRTEATAHLLSAGQAVGVKRFVAQSYAGWPYAREGGPVKTEEDPLDPTPVADMRETLAAIRQLEESVTGADWTVGIALRYGGFYGPGTSLDPAGGEHVELVRKRGFPIVGDGGGVWSFVHIADAAEATAVAVERGERGVYNVVDDEPAAVREWLPELARDLGAKPPRRVPRWLGRMLAGEAATVIMTEVRGASNAKAKRELGWAPAHPSWRQGFAELAR
jgi:nucleoside-diphosphate-sugar epimerase